MTERTTGNGILMTLICIVIFWLFMVLRPANAWQYSEEYQAGRLPPKEFDHEYHGTLTVFPIIDLTMLNFPPGCHTTLACAYADWRGPNTCAIWIAGKDEIEYQGWNYDIVMRHEIGHCNGWHHEH
jgi:hypothetical protein